MGTLTGAPLRRSDVPVPGHEDNKRNHCEYVPGLQTVQSLQTSYKGGHKPTLECVFRVCALFTCVFSSRDNSKMTHSHVLYDVFFDPSMFLRVDRVDDLVEHVPRD